MAGTKSYTPGEAVTLLVEANLDAPTAKVLDAMLRIAYKNGCRVRSTWNQQTIEVGPDEHFAAVQERIRVQFQAVPMTPPVTPVLDDPAV